MATALDFTSGLPDLAPLCVQMQSANPLCIRFPGGVRVCANIGLEFGDIAAVTRSLFANINSSLVPLNPVFDMIDVVKAILDCIQAIPDLIGPPPDPAKLLDCIPTLIQKIAVLLELLPPYSIPIMVKDICAAIAYFLLGLKLELTAFIAQEQRLIAAALSPCPGLAVVVSCANGNFAAQLANLNAAGGPLNRLIGDVNAFAQIVGLPQIPTLADLGGDAAAALATLDPVIAILQEIAALIPG
jgi:hypothetical protein